MICYVLGMGKQHLGPHVVVGYGIKICWPGLFITSPDHLVYMYVKVLSMRRLRLATLSILVRHLDTYVTFVTYYFALTDTSINSAN